MILIIPSVRSGDVFVRVTASVVATIVFNLVLVIWRLLRKMVFVDSCFQATSIFVLLPICVDVAEMVLLIPEIELDMGSLHTVVLSIIDTAMICRVVGPWSFKTFRDSLTHGRRRFRERYCRAPVVEPREPVRVERREPGCSCCRSFCTSFVELYG